MNSTSHIINLGSTEKIPAGQGRCFIIDGKEIAVFRQRDGRLFAAQNRCPHRDGPLAEGVIGDGQVVCPLHAHKFNLTSGAGSQAGECLQTYHVSESSGEILLQL